jgi:hypothetical protein
MPSWANPLSSQHVLAVMFRTVQTIPVSGRTIAEVRTHLLSWLRSKEFVIVDVDSDGSAVRFPFGIVSLLLHPASGDTVATSVRYTGAVVIEFRLTSAENTTFVHLEAYAAGAGPYSGDEWELSEQLHWTGGVPRMRGFHVLEELAEDLQTFGATSSPGSNGAPASSGAKGV